MVVHFKVLWHKIAAQNLYLNMENWAKSYSISRPIEWIMVSSLDIAEVHFFVNWQDFSFNFYFYQYIFLLFSMLKFTQTQVECTSQCIFVLPNFKRKKKRISFLDCLFHTLVCIGFCLPKKRKNWCKKYWKRWMSYNFFYIANTFVFKMLWAPTKHWHSPLKRFIYVLYVHFYRQYIDKRFVFLASCSDQQESKNRKMIINRTDR